MWYECVFKNLQILSCYFCHFNCVYSVIVCDYLSLFVFAFLFVELFLCMLRILLLISGFDFTPFIVFFVIVVCL